jgi:hypothetical protein
MTIEANGPPWVDLLPVCREILERSPLLLFMKVKGSLPEF